MTGHLIHSPWKVVALTLCRVFVGCSLAAGGGAFAQDAIGPLTNAADVISLPPARAAQYLKVSIRGVVTAADPFLNGRFFMQDATGGVFVDNAKGRRLSPGDIVEVSGITYPGAYAPTVTGPKVKVVGTGELPPAKPVSVEQLMSGSEDSQRVEISAVVRDARIDGSRLTMDLATGGYRFRAFVIAPADFAFRKLVGAEVLLRGTAAEAHIRSLRQLIFLEIYIPTLADLVVRTPETIEPFAKPVMPLNNLAQYRKDSSLSQRVHVRGVVTLLQEGQGLFLQDADGGLQVQSRYAAGFAVGETVEAAGFPGFENFHPLLEEAVFRKSPTPLSPSQPKPVTLDQLENGLHHAEYVSLTGRLIERRVRYEAERRTAPAVATTILVLQSSNWTFTVESSCARQQELAAIPLGSEIRASGVCLTDIDSDGKLRSFQLLVVKPEDVVVLQRPGWLTPQRLFIGFAITCGGLVLIAGWTVMVSRRNSVLNFLIREREQAQRELQQANDQLEERVKARTEQLKFEITSRKEAEVRFKAVLDERTRLAQELHDTVEQTLTGIALQLDTAAKLHQRSSSDSLTHLELARHLMSQSQAEVRQSVWDLRRLVQEQFDLPVAMLETARDMASGLELKIELETAGSVRSLPEIIEENFLRISREGVVNAIKYSQASALMLRLEFEPARVVLEVRDNGRGFDPHQAAGPEHGHFGLLGVSERVKRLGGRFTLQTAVGQGTTLRVEIPLAPPAETFLADALNGASASADFLSAAPAVPPAGATPE